MTHGNENFFEEKLESGMDAIEEEAVVIAEEAQDILQEVELREEIHEEEKPVKKTRKKKSEAQAEAEAEPAVPAEPEKEEAAPAKLHKYGVIDHVYKNAVTAMHNGQRYYIKGATGKVGDVIES